VVPEGLLDEAARRFALLSDPTRLRILRALHERGETSVQLLADDAQTSISNVSQHLQRLLASGMVDRRRMGKTVLYRITDPTIHALCDLVCHGLQARAAALTG
jgi:DNA-binding transcriptional ArsR family regulator